VLVSIDGLIPETYLDPDRLGLRVPPLRALHARGAFARGVESVFPSVTYPAHTTMVTGVTPRVHGITSNRPPDPLAKNHDG
jgi:predicted AlkP superfamily pyrophosphatase or phosphodiesterase